MNEHKFQKVKPTHLSLLRKSYSYLRLVPRLMADHRVNGWLKCIPIGVLIYLISPVDLLSFLPFDDLAIALGGFSLFVELCPKLVVEEHMTNLQTGIPHPFADADAEEVLVDESQAEKPVLEQEASRWQKNTGRS